MKGCLRILVVLAVFLAPGGLRSQESGVQSGKYWIFFRDKGPDVRTPLVATPAMAERAGISGRAQRRRLRAGAPIVTFEDLPVYRPYRQRLEEMGIRIAAESRWINAVSARLTGSLAGRVSRLPFVTSIRPVVRFIRREPEPDESGLAGDPLFKAQEWSLDYGSSAPQLELINVPKVHEIWIDGTGAVVGMLDNGYRWRVHEALRQRKVVAEYDFINRDSLTENEPGVDPPGQDSHGTITFSTLAGFKEGKLIGPAYEAEFYLAKTEVNGSETPIEEDYWAEGIEWLERSGAGVVSSSLAYSTFDDGSGYSYENGDYDGKTAVTTRAAARAARLGVVVVNAMGNEGNRPGTIIAPADADSIISVGAVTMQGRVAGFSSNGPTNDNRIKPDVSAPGVGVFCATRSDTASYTRANGTSLSTPLTAGVAALVRSARPELSVLQVRDALRETASQADSPDNKMGWGIVDAWEAVLYHGMVISTHPRVIWDGTANYVAAWVVSRNPVKPGSVALWYGAERGAFTGMEMRMMQSANEGSGSGLYLARVPVFRKGTKIRYYIEARDTKETRTSPYGAPGEYFEFEYGDARITGVENFYPRAFVLEQNYPNPFGPRSAVGVQTTMIEFALPGTSRVALDVYDLLGRHVARLVNEIRPQGRYVVPFSADASRLSSGVYIYRLTAGATVITRRMVFLK